MDGFTLTRARVLYGDDDAVAAWTCRLIPHIGSAGVHGPKTALGVLNDKGRLIAGMIYHDYQEAFGTVQITFASTSPMWARKSTIRELLAYPFQQLGCQKIWTCTPAKNIAALKTNAHVGLKREAILRHQFGFKEHAVIYSMMNFEFNRRYSAT